MRKILLIGSDGKMGTMIRNNLPYPYKIVSCINMFNQDIVDDDYYAVLDFSSSTATMKFAPIFMQKRIPYICGTTGLKRDDVVLLKSMCSTYNSYFHLVSNFDMTFKSFLSSLELIKNNFKEAWIEEWHNIKKVDLPSGTALALAKALQDLKIHFIVHRVQKTRFIHVVTFQSDSVCISLKHSIKGRKSYLKGIIYALDNISFNGFREGL